MKSARLTTIAASIAIIGTTAIAAPQGAAVVAGAANIATSGSTTTITNSAGAIINWNKFSIGAGEAVKFIQPSASSTVLNRVLASDPSVILGSLTSNGKVWLVNPAGIMVGPGGRIDTAGFVASTLNISNADFLAGRKLFGGDQAALAAGKITNNGTIAAADGGSIMLIAPKIENNGIVTSASGEIILAAGHSVQVVNSTTPGVSVEVRADKQDLNLSAMIASGRVYALNSGVIDVSAPMAVVADGGRIFLRAAVKDGGVAVNTGLLAAKGSQGGKGGFIDTSGSKLDLNDGKIALSKGGQWLIDPEDIVITTAPAGDFAGVATVIDPGTITPVLDTDADVTVSTAADMGQPGTIRVESEITSPGTGTLTLDAADGITSLARINMPAGSVVMRAGGDSQVVGIEALSTSITAAGSITYFGDLVSNVLLLDAGAIENWGDGNILAGTLVARAGGDAYLGGYVSQIDAISIDAGGQATVEVADGSKINIVAGMLDGTHINGINAGTLYLASYTGEITQTAPINTERLYAYATKITLLHAENGIREIAGVICNDDVAIADHKSGPGNPLYVHGQIEAYGAALRITTDGAAASGVSGDIVLGDTNAAHTYVKLQAYSGIGDAIVLSTGGNIINKSNNGTDTLIPGAGRFIAYAAHPDNAVLESLSSSPSANAYGCTLDACAGMLSALPGNRFVYAYQPTLTVASDSWSKMYGTADFATSTVITGARPGDLGSEVHGAVVQHREAGENVGSYALTPTLTSKLNYAFGYTGTATITPAFAVAAPAMGQSKVYGDPDPELTYTVFGRINNPALGIDDSGLAATGNLVRVAGETVAGGPYPYRADSPISLGPNYRVMTAAAFTAFSITPASLTVTASGVDRAYNGTAGATVSLGDNRIGADNLVLNYGSAIFAGGKHVGIGKAVDVAGITLGGVDASNYTLGNTTATTTASITAADLTLSAVTDSKQYDGTVSSAGAPSISGLFAGDSVTGAQQRFTSRNVLGAGNSTLETFGAAITDGNGGNNYVLQTATAAGTITPATLTATAAGIDRTYDGTAAATVTLSDNRIGGDTLSLDYTGATFATGKHVGIGKAVDVAGISFTGADSGNYTLGSTTASTTASITAADLYLGAVSDTKQYDGTGASAGAPSISGLLAGDSISGTQQRFASRHVLGANNSTLEVFGATISDGNGGNNYLVHTATAAGSINAAPLTISAVTDSRTYDSTLASALTPTSAGLFVGDTMSATQAFVSKDALGTGNSVLQVIGYTLNDGNSGSNYSASLATAAGTISQKSVSIAGVAAADKVYDGTASASLASIGAVATGIGGESLVLNAPGSVAFASKNVARDFGGNVIQQDVTATGYVLANGTGLASNYQLASNSAIVQASITPAALNVSATGSNRTYDGTAGAAVTLGDNRISGDTLATSYSSAAFTGGKDAGINKAIDVSGISFAGLDAGNYTLSSTIAAATANIAKASLTVTAAGIDRTYDGTSAAAAVLGDNRIAGDTLSLGYTSAAFVAGKDAGNGKAIDVAGINVSGADVGNYLLASTSASTAANITPAALILTASASDRMYDGTTLATAALGDNRIGGDIMTLMYSGASFDTKDAGRDKAVTVTGIAASGLDAGNYVVPGTALATATITPAPVVASGFMAPALAIDAAAHLCVNSGDQGVWCAPGAGLPDAE